MIKYLNDSEISELYENLKLLYEVKPRHAAFIETLLVTGARQGEARKIKRSDLRDGMVTIRGLKGSNDRVMPLPDKLFKTLNGLPVNENNEIFYRLGRQTCVRLWHSIRPRQDITLHGLRHTKGMAIMREYRDIVLVQHALGHKSLMSTGCYLHAVESVEKLKALLDKEYQTKLRKYMGE